MQLLVFEVEPEDLAEPVNALWNMAQLQDR